jgi:hypothetical protein
MRQSCDCGHTKGWHTKPPLVSEAEQLVRAFSFLPMRGSSCELCFCIGYVESPHFRT